MTNLVETPSLYSEAEGVLRFPAETMALVMASSKESLAMTTG